MTGVQTCALPICGDPEGPIITDPTRHALAGVTLSNVKKLSGGVVHSYDLGLSSGISILAFRTGEYTPNRLCFGDFTENLLSPLFLSD